MITSFCHRFAAALLFAAAFPASAASFDCDKANTDVERAVCADKQLSALDERLADAYRNTVSALGKLNIKADQREWANSRAACAKEKFNECLNQSYTDRINLLTNLGNAARDPERRLRLDSNADPYSIEAIMVDESLQGRAWVFVSNKSDGKFLQVLREVHLFADTSFGPAVDVADLNQDGVKDIALRTRAGLNGWEYYLSTKDGKFAFNQALTELQYQANEGIELEPNGEIRVVHSLSPCVYVADYKMVNGKPVLTKKETYCDGDLVESWPRQPLKKRKHSAASSN